VVTGVLLVALLVANTLNIAADAVAVGTGMNMLGAGPTPVWAAVAGIAVTVLLAAGSFALIAKVFKLLTLALLSYLVVLVLAHPRWAAVAHGMFVPALHPDKEWLALLVAVLGTTISPYLFFWQSAHRLEDMRAEPAGGEQPLPLPARRPAAARGKQARSRLDVFAGMLFSNVVMFAVITATAATVGAHGSHEIGSAAQAAQALRPLAGSAASTVFALGFIGAGMLAIPVLAGSGSVGLAGLLGHRWGFSRSIRQAPVFYALVLAGTLDATMLALGHIDPMRLLVWVAVINGVAAARS
jgi:Mn2+/Fe2+ NRAMP family transporter